MSIENLKTFGKFLSSCQPTTCLHLSRVAFHSLLNEGGCGIWSFCLLFFRQFCFLHLFTVVCNIVVATTFLLPRRNAWRPGGDRYINKIELHQEIY